MATTRQGQQLTEEHRLDQVAIKAAFLSQFVPTWYLLDFNRLDETTRGWIRVVMRLVRVFRQLSAERSERYYRDFRLVEAPSRVRLDPPAPIRYIHVPDPFSYGGLSAEDIARGARLRRPGRPESPEHRGGEVKPRIDWTEFDNAAERALLVTGPNELKRRTKAGQREDEARQGGLRLVSGTASRHVLDGGRTAQLELVRSDKSAIGWVRVTDGDPCHFCAMLASRGLYRPYKTRESASFQAHGDCACSAEPVFSRRSKLPGRSAEFRRLWDASTKGYSGKDALNAFRRAYEKQRREQEQPAAEIA